MIRKLAQQSNIYFWLAPVVVFAYYLVWRGNPLMKEGYLFLLVALLPVAAAYQFRSLSKEIIRLEEKIGELEKHITLNS
ncbi:hypothetical protein [Microcoleus sp. bin38.metabat.b11b12b14.051]|uniref:hypothetical protein n=1 Tax=Microcoleus sp. bin38.metabat.b11b12b14.051 TaxID=2742709 RepID=UPI0025F3357E|nr:hypothetical protein [Microcoleus sp. bin38.metabat.b11b12b14.051]